jgi:hypothetical protein
MTEFKVGDEVEVLYINGMGYQGDYRKGMVGTIIKFNEQVQVRLHGESIHSSWLNVEAVKLAEPQYPNPPLPHCEERIAFARGANIEFLSLKGTWLRARYPSWDDELKYRVKVEKTKDDLRIEQLEKLIAADSLVLDKYKKELAELKPTIHY